MHPRHSEHEAVIRAARDHLLAEGADLATVDRITRRLRDTARRVGAADVTVHLGDWSWNVTFKGHHGADVDTHHGLRPNGLELPRIARILQSRATR